jgi:hypothetical protein
MTGAEASPFGRQDQFARQSLPVGQPVGHHLLRRPNLTRETRLVVAGPFNGAAECLVVRVVSHEPLSTESL